MNGLVFHTEHSLQTFERHFPQCHAKKAIIPLGEFGFLGRNLPSSSVTNDNPTILFFGNIRPYKGLDDLIQAFSKVIREMPFARLAIIGQPLEPFDPYRDRINKLNLNKNIDLRLEYIQDQEIPKIFSTASLVALPYKDIDQSAVLLLALALGKAVVATEVGGIREVVQDGRTGILVPVGDPNRMAQALVDLLRNPQKISDLGRAAQKDVLSRFSWDSIAEKTRSFYSTLGSV